MSIISFEMEFSKDTDEDGSVEITAMDSISGISVVRVIRSDEYEEDELRKSTLRDAAMELAYSAMSRENFDL